VSRWTTALPILVVGVLVGGDEAPRAASLVESLAAALAPSQAQPSKSSARPQKPAAKLQVHPRPLLAHDPKPLDSKPHDPKPLDPKPLDSKPLARDPLPVELAKTSPADPADTGPVPTNGPVEALKPHNVRSVAVVPREAPPVAPAPDVEETPPTDVGEVPQQMPALTAEDLVAINAIRLAQTSAPASPPSTLIDLLMLVALCALVTTNSRGRIPPIGFVSSDGRGGSRSLPSDIDPGPCRPIGPTGDAGAGRIEWLLRRPGGRPVGDGFAYAFAHHWNSVWHCRYTGLPSGAVTFPIRRRSMIGDGFELDRVRPDPQTRLGATNQDKILLPAISWTAS
jgi:hypothetical protein